MYFQIFQVNSLFLAHMNCGILSIYRLEGIADWHDGIAITSLTAPVATRWCHRGIMLSSDGHCWLVWHRVLLHRPCSYLCTAAYYTGSECMNKVELHDFFVVV